MSAHSPASLKTDCSRRRFLLSTHYTNFNSHPAFFTLNLVALVLVGLAPKLPYFHRLRFKFFDAGTTPGP